MQQKCKMDVSYSASGHVTGARPAPGLEDGRRAF